MNSLHFSAQRCPTCGKVRNTSRSIERHYKQKHSNGPTYKDATRNASTRAAKAAGSPKRSDTQTI